MFGGLIEYVCVRGDHLPLAERNGREITINGGSWAYCPGGADELHEWMRVPDAGRPLGARSARVDQHAPATSAPDRSH